MGGCFWIWPFMGQNPDKRQAVNFNYSHRKYLLALLAHLKSWANGKFK